PVLGKPGEDGRRVWSRAGKLGKAVLAVNQLDGVPGGYGIQPSQVILRAFWFAALPSRGEIVEGALKLERPRGGGRFAVPKDRRRYRELGLDQGNHGHPR